MFLRFSVFFSNTMERRNSKPKFCFKTFKTAGRGVSFFFLVEFWKLKEIERDRERERERERES